VLLPYDYRCEGLRVHRERIFPDETTLLGPTPVTTTSRAADLAYPHVRLAIEYDGAEHRTQRRARRDLIREAALRRWVGTSSGSTRTWWCSGRIDSCRLSARNSRLEERDGGSSGPVERL
jgi:hypothetical protein